MLISAILLISVRTKTKAQWALQGTGTVYLLGDVCIGNIPREVAQVIREVFVEPDDHVGYPGSTSTAVPGVSSLPYSIDRL